MNAAYFATRFFSPGFQVMGPLRQIAAAMDHVMLRHGMGLYWEIVSYAYFSHTVDRQLIQL